MATWVIVDSAGSFHTISWPAPFETTIGSIEGLSPSRTITSWLRGFVSQQVTVQHPQDPKTVAVNKAKARSDHRRL
jgi:hypothetical protein